MLSPAELRTRLAFDYEVASRMVGRVFDLQAFASTADLAARRNPVEDETEGHRATKYRVLFSVPTLVGPGQFAPETEVGIDLSVRGYPIAEPLTWVQSSHVPFSPHFKKGAPVCIGEIWREARGHMLLGSLLVHIARLLNWDEIARGGGYVGWNPAAVAYHAEVYGQGALDPDLVYPSLPLQLTHGLLAPEDLFTPRRGGGRDADGLGLFTPARRIHP
ncbi:MAG: hypothetical protein ACRD0Q_00650 [Acidimicrobiales bacterium]